MRCLLYLTTLLALLACDDGDPDPPDLAQGADGGRALDGSANQDGRVAEDGGPGDPLDAAAPDAEGADVGARDAATMVGAPPVLEIENAPRLFNACWESCTAQSLRFAVEDPDGVADLAGGQVIVLPSGAVLAELGAMTRRHVVDLTWRTLHTAQGIDFDGGDTTRRVRIEYADRQGNLATAELELRLVCPDGGPACDGLCAQGECFPFVRTCAANRACEYHPARGGDGGSWTCDRTGAGRVGALCGPDAPCAVGFSCFRRETVGCDGFAPGDGCCTPRCRPGQGECPDTMRCRPRGGDQACAERLGFCVFE